MTALLLLLLAAPPAPVKARPPDAPVAPRPVAPLARPPAPAHEPQTQCGVCHATTAWTDVRFNHERTGFPLTGQHTTVTCKACHPVSFMAPLARGCVGCHRDVHAGDLGARCESCHDTATWRSRLDADAHRRSNFPLLGGHAGLPCVECHLETAERRFSRTAVECLRCHEPAFRATAATTIDHTAAGFDQPDKPCVDCHNGFRFKPARYPQHQACFVLSGPHAVACASCHQPVPNAPSSGRACGTGTATCMGCHDCRTPGNDTDREHREVQGYGTTCTTTKCLLCHGGTQ